MRRIEPIVVGLAIALVVIGLSVRVLTAPFVTTALLDATGGAELTGLDAATARGLAQQVRGYVTGAYQGELPERVGERDGFSANAVSHLDDVRGVIRSAGLLTLALLLVAGVWAVARWRGGRRGVVGAAMKAAAYWLLLGVPIAVVFALLDFDRFFAGFHALFFEAGTWQFPAGDLLIQLFPESFWASAGALWGALVLAAAVALMLGSRAVAGHVQRGFSAGRLSDM